MERKFDVFGGELPERMVKNDPESPRRCHILALYYVNMCQVIPQEVCEALVEVAERDGGLLKQSVDSANGLVKAGVGDQVIDINYSTVLATMARTYGSTDPGLLVKRMRVMADTVASLYALN